VNRQISSGFLKEQWQQLLQFHPFCHYCGEPLTARTATADHRIPMSKGGTHQIENIIPACHRCNSAKSNLPEYEFLHSGRTFIIACEVCTGKIKVESGKTVDKTMHNPFSICPEMENEPGLLKRLIRERERVSWAWRNPA
jgi:hypothetical protein